jgi:hypothetical protein
MTNDRDPQGQGAGERHADTQNPVFYYKDSGIRERHGKIPLWLLAVTVVLIIWGIYYLVAYWSPPQM